MKLDAALIETIKNIVYENLDTYEPMLDNDAFAERLAKLDVVVKPGDSSQSTLTENK